MGKSKSPSVEIPAYSPPPAQQYSLPGLGSTNYANNTWGFTETPDATAYRMQLETLRNSVLKGLGITSPQREASLNKWQDTFTQEALRTSMPQLENTLFGRGMGGSRLYQDAVTDLLSKVATQGVLNREELSNRDESLKLSQLSNLSNLWQTNASDMSGLLNAATGQTNANNQQAWNQYATLLPYLAKVNAGSSSPWGTIGSILGAGAGFGFGGLTGAGIGSAIGGGLGGIAGGSPSQLDLSWLSMLGKGNTGATKSYNPYSVNPYATQIKPQEWKLSNPF